MGPQALRIGDIVFILFGAGVPFVRLGRYQAGEAYVHGIMDGEAFEGLDYGEKRERREQVFELH